MPEQKWIVAIAGAPATGKSALAALLRARFGWPLLTKDGIKETLFETLGAGDRAWSRRLSDASFELLFRFAADLIRDAPVSVLEGNFRAPAHLERLRDLADAHGTRLLIVDLHAEASVTRQRLRARAIDGVRHPGHLDRELAAQPELAAASDIAGADPVSVTEPRESGDVWLRRDTSVLDDAVLDAIASAVAVRILACPVG